MYKALESFMNYCDEMIIATESDAFEDTCNVSFFGKTYKCTVYYENMKKEDIPAAKERLKTFLKEKPWNNKKVFDELFKTNSRLIKSVNEDPYFDGKKVNNGNDLLKSISRIDVIQVSKRHIVMSGEYWLDDEHGFSIDFPNGKFITKGDQEDKLGDEVNFTRLSSHMDLREYDR